ncbi:hypothetical protein GCM10012280_51500 [Wenjunlia tyrosinilytica]|uniref:Band 7 domain-containing protein n=1 Tax=Wenjunlia tyrosinilytica TaxID=1544741 RepID=A0A917ZX63_9ACTN|nr:hypothetical protein GCM10012280_51500 [Wenjunlia tyrosinilytica]
MFVILLLGSAGCVGWFGRVAVPTDHVGIVRRRIGRSDPNPVFNKIAPNNTRGIQARTLLPDRFTWLMPGVYTVEFVPRVHIPAGRIGLVRAKEGRGRPANRPIATHVECDNFQDGQRFLLAGGEQGQQVATLAGDQSYRINTKLFSVEIVPRTYVPPGTIGLVEARAGKVRPPDQPFGRFVECNSFQDGHAFLSGGGEQGKQLAILGGGTHYDINTALFHVITVDNVSASLEDLTADHLKEISIPVGETGVVIALDGAEPERTGAGTVAPRVPGHRSFRLPWVFLDQGGQRGVQEETLGEGTVYALNPWLVRVMLIPTRLLILKWTNKSDSESVNYDAALEQIAVNVQGHRLHVEMSQNLQIPREAAPKLVSRFGGTQTSGIGGLVHDRLPVQRFVRDVLGATVAGYFSGIATASTVREFLREYDDTRTLLTDKVRAALDSWGVQALSTTLGDFEPEDPSLYAAFKNKFDSEMHGEKLEVDLTNAGLEDRIDAIRVAAEKRRTGMELEAEINALGRDNVAMIRIVREFSKMQVPDYIGGGDVSGYVQALPMGALRDLLGRLRQLRTEHQLSPDAAPRLTKGEPESEQVEEGHPMS